MADEAGHEGAHGPAGRAAPGPATAALLVLVLLASTTGACRSDAETGSPAPSAVAPGSSATGTIPGRLTPETSNLYWSVAAGADGFVAVGNSGIVITSPDGVSWTPRPAPTTETLRGV